MPATRKITRTVKENWFKTLADALESEGLEEYWDNHAISYGETHSLHAILPDGYLHFISVYRSTTGSFERPVHYKCRKAFSWE